MTRAELLYTCPGCDGWGECPAVAGAEARTCILCDGDGTVSEDPYPDDGDDEPGDIDSDEGYDPYTGGCEDMGYDTGD